MTEQTHNELTPSAPALKTLAIIDGANYMFRAYHAMKNVAPLSAPDGTPTGALATFATMISKAKAAANADALVIVFESTIPTFRDQLVDDYKAQRPETPSDVKIQMNLARTLFPLMGVPVIWSDGFEADDVMCAYAAHPCEGWQIVMCSSDKDLSQLVGPRVKILDPNGMKMLDEKGILDKFGVPPSLMAQLLAIKGDSVDNIKGVSQVGEKTAPKLLNQYGSIEGIYNHLDQLTKAVRQGFEEARDRIPLLMQLTVVDINAPRPLTCDEIYQANRHPDWSSALEILRPLALRGLIAKAEKGEVALAARAHRNAKI